MNTPFTLQDQVGAIVSKFPKASDLFKQYRIDFCCGGNRSLKDAASGPNLDAEAILAELNHLYETSTQTTDIDWTTASYTDLVNHIVNRYHAYLNENLPNLSAYATKILRVHGAGHPELREVHQLFHQLKMELEQHTIKEETEVFPLILQYDETKDEALRDTIVAKLEELEAEHDGAGDILKKLRDVTDDFTPPADGCTSYRLTFQLLEELESDTFEHVHLENNILFPRLANR